MPKLIKELGRVGGTRYLVWEEYIAAYPEGVSYRRFCRKIKQYNARQQATLRLDHKAAHRQTLDFTGKKIPWVEKVSGLVHDGKVLGCTLPYSGYTYACAVASQNNKTSSMP